MPLAGQTTASNSHRLENQITELAANIHAANYRLLQMISEFDEHGSWIIRGRLTAEQAAVIKKAMEVAMDESFQSVPNDGTGN